MRANLEAIVAEEASEKAKDFCGIFAESCPGDVARLARIYAKSPRYTWRVYISQLLRAIVRADPGLGYDQSQGGGLVRRS